MSDTPRTDEREALSEGLHEGWGLRLARQLERELNAVTSERDALLQQVKRLKSRVSDLEEEIF